MASRIITSPGVEIRERDLSLRVATPVGTNVLVPGFAPQGPTGEPILVTTISEFEQIFGQPATAAERYLYYSMKEAVNSPANVWCVRIPYGGEEGIGWTNSYSALFYPMSGTATGWQIGIPKNVTLNLDDYTNLLRGDFEWGGLVQETQTVNTLVNTVSVNVFPQSLSAEGLAWALANDSDGSVSFALSASGTYATSVVLLTSVVTTTVATQQPVYVPTDGPEGLFSKDENGVIHTNAGFFIVNTLQTSINEVGEGYYIGVATNKSARSGIEDFNSIGRMTSLNAISAEPGSTNYFNIPSSRLEFSLSSTKAQSDSGVTSISETLEKAGFRAFDTDEYQDHLAFVVYRIRRSLADAGLLALASIEKYIGSLDINRKMASPTGGVLENAFIEDIVNAGSGSIKVNVNPVVSRYGWTSGSSSPVKEVVVATEAKSLYPVGVYAPNTLAVEQSKQIGNVPAKLSRALQLASNSETYTIDVIIDAGLSTIHSVTNDQYEDGLGNFNDEVYADLEHEAFPGKGTVRENWQAVASELIYFAEGARKDCIAVIDPHRTNFVVGKGTKVMDIQTNNFTDHIYTPLKNCFDTLDSNYATAYANWIKVNDNFTSKKFWLPFSGYAAAVIARSDAATNAWGAPAGFARGGFNALDIAFNPNQKQRDRLYDIPVNPVIFFSGDGYAVYGQKTLQNRPTAFDRLNVRRLFLSLERSVAKTIRYFVFEPNTTSTRTRIVSTLAPAFNYAKNTDGLFDYLIVCDERNNTPTNVDNGEIVVDIYIKPVRTAEFILVNFIATRTGQEFSEVI